MGLIADASLCLFILLFIVFLVMYIKPVLVWSLIIGVLILCFKYNLFFWVPLGFLALFIWGCIVYCIRKFIAQLRNNRKKKILHSR